MEGIPGLYESHFLRDITYSASGSMVIAAIFLAFSGRLAPLAEAIESHILIALIIVAASYILGLLMQEGFVAIGIFQTHPKIPEPYQTRHILMSEISKFSPIAIREIERTIYLKHVGSAIGSATIVSSVALLVASCLHDISYLFGLLFTLPILVICLHLNKVKVKEQEDALKEYASKLQSSESDAA